MNEYNLGNYRFKNYKIYKKVWWIFYKCISGYKTYNTYFGVKEVKKLCGIVEEKPDYSHLERLFNPLRVEGKYLVNFKEDAYPIFHGNAPLPALITKRRFINSQRLEVVWENGWTVVIHPSHLNIYKINPNCKGKSL